MFVMPVAGWQWQRNTCASPQKSKDETIKSTSSLGDLKSFAAFTRDAERGSLEEFERAYFMKKNHQTVMSGTQTGANSRKKEILI